MSEMKVNRNYKRGFLIAASAYRRHAKDFDGDFSAAALRQQYEHETFGNPVASDNGYAVGKWMFNVTIAAMKDDYEHGLFAKCELLHGSCYATRKIVRQWMPVALFVYAIPSFRRNLLERASK